MINLLFYCQRLPLQYEINQLEMNAWQLDKLSLGFCQLDDMLTKMTFSSDLSAEDRSCISTLKFRSLDGMSYLEEN